MRSRLLSALLVLLLFFGGESRVAFGFGRRFEGDIL